MTLKLLFCESLQLDDEYNEFPLEMFIYLMRLARFIYWVIIDWLQLYERCPFLEILYSVFSYQKWMRLSSAINNSDIHLFVQPNSSKWNQIKNSNRLKDKSEEINKPLLEHYWRGSNKKYLNLKVVIDTLKYLKQCVVLNWPCHQGDYVWKSLWIPLIMTNINMMRYKNIILVITWQLER